MPFCIRQDDCVVSVLKFMCMVHYIYWFACVEPFASLWDKVPVIDLEDSGYKVCKLNHRQLSGWEKQEGISEIRCTGDRCGTSVAESAENGHPALLPQRIDQGQ